MIHHKKQKNFFRLMVATSEGTFFLYPEEIVRLEASSNYTMIHFTNGDKIITAKVLKSFEAILEPMGFVRTHRTHLVNRNYISFVTPDGRLKMSDDSTAEISRRMKSKVMRVLRARRPMMENLFPYNMNISMHSML